MIVKIRDSRHKYYKQKFEIYRIDRKNDEIVLFSKEGKKVYLKNIDRSQKYLKRVIPSKMGSKIMVI